MVLWACFTCGCHVQVLEAMADGGVRAGLPRHQALQLAAQTMKGAACMVLEGDENKPNTASAFGHPGVLKDQVRHLGSVSKCRHTYVSAC